ncbi:MAG TPA: hypothetical protein VLH37_03115 [Bacteroidales bacterium]|nr:hypothetical protein [Bacteroidales bacterium]
MTKILCILGWICGAVGAAMMLLGVIAVFAGGIFLDSMWQNYFYPGVGFLVLGIFLFNGLCCCKKCDCNCCENDKDKAA